MRIFGFLEHGLHLVGVGHEVRRDIASVELHTLNDLDLCLGTLGLLDCNDTLFLHLTHCLCDELADESIVVGGCGGDLLYLCHVLTDFLSLLLQVSHNCLYGLVDTAFQVHRVGACGHVLQTYADNLLSEDCSGSGTVTGLVVGLGKQPPLPSEHPCSGNGPPAPLP